MASRNGSPGSHSADTAGHCCTRRSTASRSARLSQASHSAYSSGGPDSTERQPGCRRCTWCPAGASCRPTGTYTWCRWSCEPLPGSPRTRRTGAWVSLEDDMEHHIRSRRVSTGLRTEFRPPEGTVRTPGAPGDTGHSLQHSCGWHWGPQEWTCADPRPGPSGHRPPSARGKCSTYAWGCEWAARTGRGAAGTARAHRSGPPCAPITQPDCTQSGYSGTRGLRPWPFCEAPNGWHSSGIPRGIWRSGGRWSGRGRGWNSRWAGTGPGRRRGSGPRRPPPPPPPPRPLPSPGSSAGPWSAAGGGHGSGLSAACWVAGPFWPPPPLHQGACRCSSPSQTSSFFRPASASPGTSPCPSLSGPVHSGRSRSGRPGRSPSSSTCFGGTASRSSCGHGRCS